MIISPFFQINESEVLISVRGIAYTVNTNTNEISEAQSVPASFLNLVDALQTFTFENSEIRWYHGVSRMKYSINENKFYLSNGEIVKESFINHILTAGVIRYEDRGTAELFVEAASNVDKFITLDFVQTFEGKSNIIDLFKLEENVYATTFNKSTKLVKFDKFSTANSALEYVNSKTGQDATQFLGEALEGEAAERAVKLEKIEEFNNIVSFLKDQRGLLADADRSIEEIKAADALIESEISRFETEISTLKESL